MVIKKNKINQMELHIMAYSLLGLGDLSTFVKNIGRTEAYFEGSRVDLMLHRNDLFILSSDMVSLHSSQKYSVYGSVP